MTVGSIVKKKTKAESRGIPHMTTALKPERGRGFQKYPKFADKQDIQGWAKEWALGCVNPAS